MLGNQLGLKFWVVWLHVRVLLLRSKAWAVGEIYLDFFSCFTSKGVTKRRCASWHRLAFLNVCHGLVHGLIHVKKQGLLAWGILKALFLRSSWRSGEVASCCSVILLVSKSVGWCGRKGAVVGDPDTVLVSDVCERQTWSDRVPRDVVKLLKAYSFCQSFFFFPSGF